MMAAGGTRLVRYIAIALFVSRRILCIYRRGYKIMQPRLLWLRLNIHLNES